MNHETKEQNETDSGRKLRQKDRKDKRILWKRLDKRRDNTEDARVTKRQRDRERADKKKMNDDKEEETGLS